MWYVSKIFTGNYVGDPLPTFRNPFLVLHMFFPRNTLSGCCKAIGMYPELIFLEAFDHVKNIKNEHSFPCPIERLVIIRF